ncbi:MAG: ABC transporter substrate-binding protein [archaeon]
MSALFNSKNKKIVLGIILLAVIIGGSYGVYILFLGGGPEPSEPESTEPEIISMVDATGEQVNITLPVNRIVTLTTGWTDIVCALGGADLIVARNEYSTFPSSMVEKPVVAESSRYVNVELVLEQEPDLVLADVMMSPEIINQIRDAGIPLIIGNPANISLVISMINNCGRIVNNEDKAAELVDWIDYYVNLVEDRTSTLSESEKLSVFLISRKDMLAFGPLHPCTDLISTAGGTNIVTDSSIEGITVSSEFVIEQNPDIIIKMSKLMTVPTNVTYYQSEVDAIMSQPELSEVTAIMENNVCFYNYLIIQGIRYPVSLVSFAKWMHPALFEDIDPTAVHEELIQKFFGEELTGVFVYPEDHVYVDETGEPVKVPANVERVVSLSTAWTEIICALGGEDLIVGRNEDSIFPSSMVEKPVVGESSRYVNVEMLLELEPDLVLSDKMMTMNPELISQIRDFGIPLIVANTADTSLVESMIRNLGHILDNEEKATELIDWIDSYINLVKERTSTLSSSEKPSVYVECWMNSLAWGPAGPIDDLVSMAGGVNMITNSSVEAVTVSPEFIVEHNPDFIIKMSSLSTIPTNVTFYQSEIDEIFSRTGLSSVTAVTEGNTYDYHRAIVQGIRYPVLVLYFAKWMHPALFDDIDPKMVHQELIQKFFNEKLEGVYTHPDRLIYVDETGEQVEVSLPVERIVSLTTGWTEVVCALGGEDLIVGRGEYSIFPPSMIDKPVVSESSKFVNVELLLDVAPDLVLADTMITSSPEIISQIRSAGVPLIIANPVDTSLIASMITTIGHVVDNEQKAAELVDWIHSYVNLVEERISTLSASEKPVVYLKPRKLGWSAFGPSHPVSELMSTAGGVNMIANSSIVSTTVGLEFIVEQNPDFIIKISSLMTAPNNVTSYQNEIDELKAETVLSGVTAVTADNVHLINYLINQGIRYPVGLLCFAKCMHPDLFVDIDPAAVHQEMIQNFFGVELGGIYSYP